MGSCSLCNQEIIPKSTPSIARLSCIHTFHGMCYHQWVRKSNFVCPVCGPTLFVPKNSPELVAHKQIKRVFLLVCPAGLFLFLYVLLVWSIIKLCPMVAPVLPLAAIA